jgi:hypothetical protein
MAIQRLIYGKEHVVIVFCAALLASTAGKNTQLIKQLITYNIKRLWTEIIYEQI